MRASRRFWLDAGLALLVGCSPKYELLRRAPTESAGTSGSVASNVGGGGLDLAGAGGAMALGGAEAGGLSAGADSGSPAASGGATEGGSGSVVVACASHLDCDIDTVCSASQCQPCPAAPATCAGPCDGGFQPRLALYNGCTVCECAPPSDCASSADCDDGQECYAGAQCEPGCNEPSCCTGNRCADAGCSGSPIPHCLAAGCAGGAVCLAACDAVTCACDGATWQCAEGSGMGGALGESCPQACVSP